MPDAPFRATYRLQLGPGLGFREARELVPYLRDLGISHLYLSPSLQARRGSTHGYDVVDPARISVELGGEQAFRELAGAGLGIVLDIVPNHMAASEENRHWSEPELRTKFFDVDTRTGFHRRFFDIGELAGVRIEDPAVFEATHALVLGLVREGLVDGLRIDHPDGLADPAGYLERLRRGGVEHVWVEKILEPGEELSDWPVEGTVGYEFLNDVAALFLDPRGEEPLTTLYEEFTGERRPFAELADEAKLQVATEIFEPELRELQQDVDVPNLPLALASFHVYRTYVEPWNDVVHPADREAIAAAALSDRLERILLLDERGHDVFVTRFQQTTGPVMAKGVEDTAFYRYHRLVSVNEVGGDPARLSMSVDDFHAASITRAVRFPRQLLTTQTHDTKRSADVRARIGALTWIPDEWRERVLRWRELNAVLRHGDAPDANEEYLLYQTLVGAWPIEADRLEAYLEKAMREAKVNTAWVGSNEAWEQDVKAFARSLLGHRPFLDDFEPFAAELARRGERAALGQVLLKLTSPGVPDLYNGDELLFLALVDPDNRRPVDWGLRRRLLDEVRSGAPLREETRKLALIARALDLRRRRPESFEGAYMPLDAGPRVCAFLRGRDVLVVVPVADRWDGADVQIPVAVEGRWRDVVTGVERPLAGVVPVAELVADFPVALLERESPDGRGHTSAVGESSWTPEGWDDRGPSVPERLPRVEDLPIAEHGYEREAVQQAFDSFYRHAAQLDATLRVLESMEIFARQAGDLRADIRALRAASWGPLPAARPTWRPQAEERALVRGGAVGGAAPRLALEASFIVLVAVGAALADLSRPLIVALVLVSWLIVGVSEFVASTRRASLRPALLAPRPAAAPRPEPAPAPRAEAAAEATMIEAPPSLDEVEVTEPEPEPEIAPEPVEAEADVVAAAEPVGAEAEAVPESEPVQTELEVEAEPGLPAEQAIAAAPEAPRRRWFRRRAVSEDGIDALAPPPSGHVRVVPSPELAAPEPEALSELVAEAEHEPERDPAPESVEDPDAWSEPVPEPEREALAETAPEPEVLSEPAAAPEPEPIAEAAHEPDPDPVAEAAPELVAEPEAWSSPVAEAEPEPIAEAEPEPEPIAEPASEPDPQVEARLGRIHEIDPPAFAVAPDGPELPHLQGPEPVAEVAPEAEPPPLPEEALEPIAEDGPEPDPAASAEPEPEAWPGPETLAARDEVPEPAPSPAEEQSRRRSWFRRRHVETAPLAASAVDAQVERIEVEHAIEPAQVEVPWEADPLPAGDAAPDPWEQGPEPFGIVLEPALEPDDEVGPVAEPSEAHAAEPDDGVRTPEPRPQPFRRGRR